MTITSHRPVTGRLPSTVPLGALAWIVAEVLVLVTQVVVAAGWATPYSWSGNYISDLGNTACGPFAVPHGAAAYVCSPWHAGMNAAFVVSGVLTAAGAVLLRPVWPPRRRVAVAVVLMVIAGLGKIGVGLVPENTDLGLHTLAALNAPLLSIAILLVSSAVAGRQPVFAAAGAVLAAVGLAGAILSGAGQYAGSAAYLGLGVGGMERVANYPGLLWMIIAGVVALRIARRIRHST